MKKEGVKENRWEASEDEDTPKMNFYDFIILAMIALYITERKN